MKDCIFCNIVEKKSDAEIVYEDEEVIALLDIKPFKPGHTLVIPKEHFETIYDIPEDVIAHLYKVVRKVAIAVKKAVNAEGINIIQSNERAGLQGIFHFHTHVIPRYFGDKLSRLGAVWESNVQAERKELTPVAEKIRRLI